MAGHKRHTDNARAHDARTLRTIAARMQARGDSFPLADQVIAAASALDRVRVMDARDDDTVTVTRAFADTFPCHAPDNDCNLDGPRVDGLPSCDRCSGVAPGRAACVTDSQSFVTDSQSARARTSAGASATRGRVNPIGA